MDNLRRLVWRFERRLCEKHQIAEAFDATISSLLATYYENIFNSVKNAKTGTPAASLCLEFDENINKAREYSRQTEFKTAYLAIKTANIVLLKLTLACKAQQQINEAYSKYSVLCEQISDELLWSLPTLQKIPLLLEKADTLSTAGQFRQALHVANLTVHEMSHLLENGEIAKNVYGKFLLLQENIMQLNTEALFVNNKHFRSNIEYSLMVIDCLIKKKFIFLVEHLLDDLEQELLPWAVFLTEANCQAQSMKINVNACLEEPSLQSATINLLEQKLNQLSLQMNTAFNNELNKELAVLDLTNEIDF